MSSSVFAVRNFFKNSFHLRQHTHLAFRCFAAFVISLVLVVAVYAQPDVQGGQAAPGGGENGTPAGPGGAPDGGGGMPGGPDGGAGGPGGPGGDANIGAQAMTRVQVVSAAKATFADFDSVKNKEAVETVYDFGLLGKCTSGEKSNFCPEKNLTLGDLAKAVALSTQLVKDQAIKDYLGYCKQKGLYKGTGTSTKNATGYDAAKMLLLALGVNSTNVSSNSAVDAALQEHNLTKGVESINLAQAISRENAAQMIANALSLSDGSASIPKVLHNSAVNVNSGTKTIENTRIFYLGGSAVQNAGTSVLEVRNSRIDGETSEKTKPLSGGPGALLVGGSIRTTLTLGQSHAFYINSTVNSRNWASLSTDGAEPVTKQGQHELSLYAYGSKTRTIDGGYGSYSDLFCNLFVYGTRITSAEIGIISGTYGKVTIGNISDGEANSTLAEHLLASDKARQSNKSLGSVITGGRNALMIHSVNLPPYWKNKGYSKAEVPLYSTSISIHGSTLATDLSLDKKLDYSAEQQGYIDHHAGSVIIIKSANTDMDLSKDALTADKKGTGALIQTLINNDINYMTKVPDGITYPGVKIRMTDMKAEGNILHEDYQRDMHLTLKGTALTGKVISGTVDQWNAAAKEKGFAKYIVDPNGYKTRHGVNMTLEAGSRWSVTGTSSLTGLTIGEGATISALQGKKVVMTVDGVETAVKPGTYKGEIVVNVI
jgi:hypothetical protein